MQKTIKQLKMKTTNMDHDHFKITVEYGKTIFELAVQKSEHEQTNIVADASRKGFRLFYRKAEEDVTTFFKTFELLLAHKEQPE